MDIADPIKCLIFQASDKQYLISFLSSIFPGFVIIGSGKGLPIGETGLARDEFLSYSMAHLSFKPEVKRTIVFSRDGRYTPIEDNGL